MDIKTFVGQHVSRPSGGSTAYQFSVLALDLGLDPKTPGHPPDGCKAFSDRISANGPSGPWCLTPEYYRPVGLPVTETDAAGKTYVVIKPNSRGQLDVIVRDKSHYGEREWAHSEALLAARIASYSKHFFDKHKSLPESVSLYSFFSPCKKCIGYLSTLPAKFKTPHWFFAYTDLYVKDGAAQTKDTDPFPDSKSALDAMERLRGGGWHVL